jgi:hypothetical protein
MTILVPAPVDIINVTPGKIDRRADRIVNKRRTGTPAEISRKRLKW